MRPCQEDDKDDMRCRFSAKSSGRILNRKRRTVTRQIGLAGDSTRQHLPAHHADELGLERRLLEFVATSQYSHTNMAMRATKQCCCSLDGKWHGACCLLVGSRQAANHGECVGSFPKDADAP
ncbi:hypothetical protein ATB98_04685 [Sinorhizobium saheli]|uniref:Uncharacterized protein n=1 Tax=Sinorhizobium saheli TaxID=36856 RepID=A0A178XWU5_SINSA|nr:hypothetical protein ATB98_04685 [Sinorhizobium saheli]